MAERGMREATILVTGFTPFAGLARNPSGELARALAARPPAGARVVARVFDTVYGTIDRDLETALRDGAPEAVIAFGLGRSRATIDVERFAVNVDDSATPDNAGEIRRGTAIRPDGPAAHVSTLPVAAIVEAVAALGLPARASNHAGAFLCNHLFYVARHLTGPAGMAIPVGFVHLPPLAEAEGAEGLTSAEIERAGVAVVGAVLRHLPVAPAAAMA